MGDAFWLVRGEVRVESSVAMLQWGQSRNPWGSLAGPQMIERQLSAAQVLPATSQRQRRILRSQQHELK